MSLENKSMSDAVQYCLTMLGSPIVNVELSTGQIQQCVYDAVQLFRYYNAGDGAYEDILVLPLVAGQSSYAMPDEILFAYDMEVSDNGDINQLFSVEHQILMETGILPQILNYADGASSGMELTSYDIATRYLKTVKNFFSQTYTVNFHPLTHELKVNPTPSISSTGVMYVHKKVPLENCVEHHLVKSLMLANCKILWGGIRSKYQISLPGGGTIEGSDMKSDGKEERDKIIEAFQEESEPPDIYVG